MSKSPELPAVINQNYTDFLQTHPELTFVNFVQECVDGKIWGQRLTYEQWQRKKFIDQFRSEYFTYQSKEFMKFVDNYSKGIPCQYSGNMYDWLAEVKGIELTPEEADMKLYKPESVPKETPTE